MKLATSLGLFILSAVTPLTAQTVDVLGGTTTATTRSAQAKANLLGVDMTVVLTDLEMYLDVPGMETLTFFMYRIPARSGTANLEWTLNVGVNGTGVGPAWYSSGPIFLPMVCGNHYLLGVSWPGSVTYHYDRGTTGHPISFGTWQRGNTLTPPVPPTASISSIVDVAQYHQRLTTIAIPAVGCVGTGCNPGGLLPRLVAGALPARGTQMPLDILDAASSAPAAYVFVLRPTLANPIQFLGCPAWLDLTAPVASTVLVTSPAGVANLRLAIPANPLISGLQLSSQAGVLGPSLSFTNALDLTVN